MDTKEKTLITVQTTINTPIEKVWKLWTSPELVKICPKTELIENKFELIIK